MADQRDTAIGEDFLDDAFTNDLAPADIDRAELQMLNEGNTIEEFEASQPKFTPEQETGLIEYAAANAPTLTGTVGQLRYNDSLKKGDIAEMGYWTKLFKSIGSGAEIGMLQVDRGLLEAQRHFGAFTDDASRQELELKSARTQGEIELLSTDPKTGGGTYGLTGVSSIPHETFKQLPNVFGFVKEISDVITLQPDNLEEYMAKIAGSTPIGTIFAPLLAEVRDERRSQGGDPNDPDAALGDIGVAAFSTGLELVGLLTQTKAAKTIGKTALKTAGMGAGKTFAKKGLLPGAQRTLKEVFKGISVEVGTEEAQTILAKGWAGYATALERGDEDPVSAAYDALTSDAALADYEETAIATAKAAVGFMGLGAPMAGLAHVARNAQAKQRAVQMAIGLEAVKQSQVDQSIKSDVMPAITQDAGNRRVTMRARQWVEIAEEHDLDPAATAEQMGMDRESFEAMVESDGVAVFDHASFILQASEHIPTDKVVDKVSVEHDGLTAEQAEEQTQEIQDDLQKFSEQEETEKLAEADVATYEELSDHELIDRSNEEIKNVLQAKKEGRSFTATRLKGLAKTLEGRREQAGARLKERVQQVVSALPETLAKEVGEVKSDTAEDIKDLNARLKSVLERIPEDSNVRQIIDNILEDQGKAQEELREIHGKRERGQKRIERASLIERSAQLERFGTAIADTSQAVTSASKPAYNEVSRVVARDTLRQRVQGLRDVVRGIHSAIENVNDTLYGERTRQDIDAVANEIMSSDVELGPRGMEQAKMWGAVFHNIAARYGLGSGLDVFRKYGVEIAGTLSNDQTKLGLFKPKGRVSKKDGTASLKLDSVAVYIKENVLGSPAEAGVLSHEMVHAILHILRDVARYNVAANNEFQGIDNAIKDSLAEDGVAIADGEEISDKKKRSDYNERGVIFFEGWLQSANLPESIMPFVNVVRDSIVTLYRHLKTAFIDKGRVREGSRKGQLSLQPPKELETWFNAIFSRPLEGIAAEAVASTEVVDYGESLFLGEDAMEGGIDGFRQSLQGLGLTDSEIEQHIESIKKAQQDAIEGVAARLRGPKYKSRKATWDGVYLDKLDEALDDLESSPQAVVIGILQRNETPRGDEIAALDRAIKLDHKDAVRLLGEEEVGRLNSLGRNITRKGASNENTDKVDLHTAAVMLGMESEQELVDILRGNRGIPAMAHDIAIEKTTQELGEFTNLEEIENEVRDEINQSHKEKVLRDQVKILHSTRFAAAKKVTQRVHAPARTSAQYKQEAQEYIRRQDAFSLNPKTFEANMRRHAKAAHKAYWKGDFQAAAEAKVKEIQAYHYYRAALDAVDARSKLQDLGKKLSGKPSQLRIGFAENQLLEHVNQIIRTLGIGKPFQTVAPNIPLAQLISNLEQHGVPAAGFETIDGVENPTVEEMNKAYQFLRLASKVASGITLEKRAEQSSKINTIVDEASELLEDHKRPGAKYSSPFERGKKGLGSRLAAVLAPMARMQFVFRYLDYGKLNGFMQKQFYQRLNDGLRRADALMRGHQENMMNLFKIHEISEQERQDMHRKEHEVQGFQEKLSTWNIVMLFLNQGNEHNKAVLEKGMLQTTQADIDVAINTVDKKYLDLAQDILHELSRLKPEIFALHREITGITPEAVEAIPIHTRHGTYEGGYFPIAIDSQAESRLTIGGNINIGENIGQAFVGGGAMTMIKKNHTQQRGATHGRPLILEPIVIAKHMNQVTHDLGLRRAVRDVWSILDHPQMRKDLVEILGDSLYRQMGQWVVDVAQNSKNTSLDGMEKFLGKLRRNFTTAVLGFNAGTWISQTTGILLSIDEIGPKYVAIGLARATKNPIDMYEWATERSSFMRDRLGKGIEREVRQAFEANQNVLSKTKGWNDGIQRAAMTSIGIAQMLVDLPTFIGAYEKAIAGNVDGVNALNERDALRYAEDVVKATQAGVDVIDLSGIQRKQGIMQWLTMFYSYFNIVFNRLASAGFDIYRDGIGAVPAAAGSVMALFAVAVMEDILRGRYDPDDDEEWDEQFIGTAASYPFESVIFVRDVVGIMKQDYQYGRAFGGTPYDGTVKALASTAKLGRKVYKGKKLKMTDFRQPTLAVGILSGLPAMQLYKSADGLLYLMSKDSEKNGPALNAYRAVVNKRGFGGP